VSSDIGARVQAAVDAIIWLGAWRYEVAPGNGHELGEAVAGAALVTRELAVTVDALGDELAGAPQVFPSAADDLYEAASIVAQGADHASYASRVFRERHWHFYPPSGR
jgi:hypothetical protein